jgi:hypothetical protein
VLAGMEGATYCSQCGNRVERWAQFCERCGAHVDFQPQERMPGIVRVWLGAMLGAALAFLIWVLVNDVLAAAQVRNALTQILAAVPMPVSLSEKDVAMLRRALVGFSVYSQLLLPIRASLSTPMGTLVGHLSVPLAGGLVFVGLPLVLAGYLVGRIGSAGTPQEGLRRGGLVAVPFAVLLLLSLRVLPVSWTGGEELGALTTLRVGPSGLTTVAYGLLWGFVFGGLGGLWSAGGNVREAIRSFLAARLPGWGPSVYGACVSVACGLAVAAVAASVGVLVAAGPLASEVERETKMKYRPGLVDYIQFAVWGPPSLGVLTYPLLHGVPVRFGGNMTVTSGESMSVSVRGGASLLSRSAWWELRETGKAEERGQERLPGPVYLALLIPAVVLAVGGYCAGGLSAKRGVAAVGLRFAASYSVLLVPIWYFSRLSGALSGSVPLAIFSGSLNVWGEVGYSLPVTLVAGLVWAAVFGTLGAAWAGGGEQSCGSCGAPLAAGSVFCERCGASSGPGPAGVKRCSGCGAPLATGARFCEDCGRAVEG